MHFSGRFGCPASCCSNVGNGVAPAPSTARCEPEAEAPSSAARASASRDLRPDPCPAGLGRQDRLDRLQRQFSAGLHHARIGQRSTTVARLRNAPFHCKSGSCGATAAGPSHLVCEKRSLRRGLARDGRRDRLPDLVGDSWRPNGAGAGESPGIAMTAAIGDRHSPAQQPTGWPAAVGGVGRRPSMRPAGEQQRRQDDYDRRPTPAAARRLQHRAGPVYTATRSPLLRPTESAALKGFRRRSIRSSSLALPA